MNGRSKLHPEYPYSEESDMRRAEEVSKILSGEIPHPFDDGDEPVGDDE